MIERIELTNITSYLNEEVILKSGLNVIQGPNGSGKSTLVKAIGLCLFDALSQTHSSFIRSGRKSGLVSITFYVYPYHYKVSRLIGLQPSYELFNVTENEKIAEGKDDTFRQLRQLFSLSPDLDLGDLWRYVIGVPQGEHNSLFNLTETKRKQVISSILNLDKYERAWNKLREPVRLVMDEMKEVGIERDKLKTVIESWGDIAYELQSHVVRYTLLEDDIIPKSQARLLELKAQITQYSGYGDRKVMERQRDGLLKEIQNMEQLLIKKAGLEITSAEYQSYASQEEESDKLYYKSVSIRQSDNGCCPVCGRLLGKEEIEKLSDKYLSESKTILDNLPALKAGETFSLLLDKARSELSKLNWVTEVYLADKQAQFDSLTQILKLMGEIDLKSLQDEHSKLLFEHGKFESDLRWLRKTIDTLKTKLTQIETMKQKVASLESELQKLNTVKETIEAGREAVRSLGGPMAEKLLTYLSSQSTRYLSEFGFDFKLTMTSNCDIIVSTALGELHASQLSGGQQTALSIALRLALINLISPSLNFLVLDEPSGNLDTDHQLMLADHLQNFSSSQLLLITHHHDLFVSQNKIDLSLVDNKTAFSN